MTVAAITRKDLHDSVMLFVALHQQPTFAARDFAGFTEVAALRLEEEAANETLLEMVAAGFLHEVGPGVYALAEGRAVPLEQPLWPEDGPQ